MTGLYKSPCQHGLYDQHKFFADGYAEKRICPGGILLPEDTLVIVKEDGETWPAPWEFDWRCWREDGSYYGPCNPKQLDEWKAMGDKGWFDRHSDCGFQLSVMLDALAAAQRGDGCEHGMTGPHAFPDVKPGEMTGAWREQCPGPRSAQRING